MRINPSEEFHAHECKFMDRSARRSEDKAIWTCMSERWQRCAEWFGKETLAVIDTISTKHPRRELKLAHHSSDFGANNE